MEDKLLWIEKNLPYNYTLLIRTNNCDYTLNTCGKWLVNLRMTNDGLRQQLYKVYTDDLNESLDFIVQYMKDEILREGKNNV